MKITAQKSLVLGALALLGWAVAAQAAPSITLLGDTGTSRVTTYNASNAVTGLSSNVLVNPYGVPPGPTVVTITPGVQFSVTFPLTSDFMAFANNTPTGKSVLMDGKLSFYITLDTPAKLTTNIYENGTYATTGNGTIGLTGGAVVSGVNANLIVLETKSNSFPVETRTATTWSLFDQVTGFSQNYTTYKVSLDNTLLAESLSAGAAGSAFVRKTNFTIIFTTDGSAGTPPNVPEPASLGVLALGGLALLARRRKA